MSDDLRTWLLDNLVTRKQYNEQMLGLHRRVYGLHKALQEYLVRAIYVAYALEPENTSKDHMLLLEKSDVGRFIKQSVPRQLAT